MDAESATRESQHTVSALAAMRGAETLAAYVGVCPTCLGWDDPTSATSERSGRPGRAACPTCGLCSVEWDLSVAIEAELASMAAMDRLGAAVTADDGTTAP